MKRKGIRFLALLSAAALAACGGGEKPAEADHGHAHEEGEAHEHDGEEHAHEGEEAAGGGHSHGTVEHKLGAQEAGGFKFEAVQMDDVTAGGETVFIVHSQGSEPTSVRLWVGDESASTSTKILADKGEGQEYHAHVEAPNPLGAGDRFWVEADGADGAKTKLSFDLAGGAVLPPQGPHTGFVVPLNGPDGAAGYAELKLHDDKGDLELWLAQDSAMTQPLDLPADSVIAVSFPDKSKNVELRVRNTEKNEDEEGNPSLRDGRTNYFIFPGATGADASWLMGDFRSTAVIQVNVDGKSLSSGNFTLVPHTHGPGDHQH
jgi:hypothetical protein